MKVIVSFPKPPEFSSNEDLDFNNSKPSVYTADGNTYCWTTDDQNDHVDQNQIFRSKKSFTNKLNTILPTIYMV